MTRTYVTVSIPYVNARPHVGYALELVQADAFARARRARGDDVRLLGGTDDHALKNVLAADEAGVSTRAFVDRNAERFAALAAPLAISFDDFIRTSHDPRHRSGVERLWRRCAEQGDFYRRQYEGRYCVGCEQFYAAADLVGGLEGVRCPEHGTPLESVAEENWFFRLSRYQDRIRDLLESGELRIEPPQYRNEVLAFVRRGLDDLSVSRSRRRARDWGIPVPGDPTQVVYVWWDALGNYVTALDYGTGGDAYRTWWVEADERVHFVGKGIVRFHAVYWPALLLSAREPLPSAIVVHPYLTADGRKLSKSAGNGVDPVELCDRFGVDALRWWLLADVPRTVDADFTVERLVQRHDEDLANGVGNLVHRVVTMLHRFRDGRVPPRIARNREARPNDPAAGADLRRATQDVRAQVERCNRQVEAAAPWSLARAERDGEVGAAAALDAVLTALVDELSDWSSSSTPWCPHSPVVCAPR